MKRASAARLTLPRGATSRKPSTWRSWMPLGFPLRDSSMATAGRYKFYLWRPQPRPPGRDLLTNGEELAPVPSQQDAGRRHGDDPHRCHRDHERPDGVAVGVRDSVESLEDRDGSVQQQQAAEGKERQKLPVHVERNGRPAAWILLDMAVFFGFHMPNFTFPGVPPDKLFDRVVENAKAAESAGFDLVTVMDHFYQIRGVGPETAPMLEAYTTLAGIAAQTTKIKVGTLVTGVTYRNPALLAKQVTTLDVISKGRAMLGIGAAWNESEHIGYGIGFPPIAERIERPDEGAQLAKLLFPQAQPSVSGDR